jgi:hypothetical protein
MRKGDDGRYRSDWDVHGWRDGDFTDRAVVPRATKDLDSLPSSLINLREYLPASVPGWTAFRRHGASPYFRKEQCYLDLESQPYEILSRMMHELCICEAISRSPHPNVCRYLGCETDEGYVSSLVFKILGVTLEEAFRKAQSVTPTRSCATSKAL